MKKDFRKKVIEYRNNKDTDFISTNSQKITEKLLSMNCIKDANTIMLYLDFNNEVKTDQLITKLISLRKTVAAPVTIKDERKLIPFKITNLKDGINIGAYGIREPKKDPSNELNVEDIDILIVPAVAYDKDCYRLGYGGGFYDRYLEKHPQMERVAIAFSFQMLPEVPTEPTDICPQIIVTEKETCYLA